MQPPHLLYVAWGYPPSRGAGMYRALATGNAFARAGWRVTVLTATRDTFERLTGSDPAMEERIDPRIEVVRIPFDPDRGEDDLRRWSRLRVYSPLLWNALRWARSMAIFPEFSYAGWLRPLTRAALAVHQRAPVSLVLGTANPNVDLMPGYVLHRRHGVPYVVDHRDAWNLDVYTGKRTASRLSRAGRLERRIMRNATEGWYVNQPIRDWHAREYPEVADRLHVVANGYDRDLLSVDRAEAPDPERDLVVGYLGTLYGPLPLTEALEGWRLARTRSDAVRRARLVFRGRLGHFAEPDQQFAARLAEFRDDGVSYEGPVSKSEVSDVYSSFDALMLIISRSRYVTSGKVFEYAATGLPIAALFHPETAATSVLDGHPASYPAAEVSVESFADAIIAAVERARTWTRDDLLEAQRWATRHERDEQLRPRIEALTAAIDGRTA